MTSIQARNINHPDHVESLKAEKYNIIRAAMLGALSPAEWTSFADLEARVRGYLDDRGVPQALFPKPGSVRWYCKAVQLDLEARGEIERQPKKSPLHLRRVKQDETKRSRSRRAAASRRYPIPAAIHPGTIPR